MIGKFEHTKTAAFRAFETSEKKKVEAS
ncbi:hypothetical protein PB2503_00537 [Parvularcula bermudensis HTCC2503]|uniref:Uncharacterized protein n=1 Tax=Parvularcula bermudensis (strain ATCC BAA-594 / HTCC2503 / KCTC 12087) TaxID=314260 RepID=E0TAX9_PARBH|nr:hypothetical protein PB2503_00537 [Parvularcula bermudensis HTCC2503]